MSIDASPPNSEGRTSVTPQDLCKTVQHCLDQAGVSPELPLALAVSGGLDSIVLLHVCHALQRPGRLLALHVNHGLQANANDWEQAVHSICRQWGVSCRSTKVSIERRGKGLESAARDARYTWLLRQAQPTGVLLLAHHCNDQSETVLLHALRGSGARGLGAMSMVSVRQGIRLVRPLLNIGKRELRNYAQGVGLKWHDDVSNDDISFDRNYLRQRVMPVLRERWPHADAALSRVAGLQQSSQALLQDLGNIDLANTVTKGHWPDIVREWPTVNLSRLLALPERRVSNALLVWFERHALPSIPATRMRSLLALVRSSTQGAVEWSDCQVSCYRDHLYLQHRPGRYRDQLTQTPVDVDSLCDSQVIDFGCPNRSVRLLLVHETPGLNIDRLSGRSLVIRSRRPGDRLAMVGHGHHTDLKKLFQANGIPKWARAVWPLLATTGGEADDEIVAVPGLAVSDKYASASGGSRFRVQLDLGWADWRE